VEWVEHGKAPERIEASRIRDGEIDRTRPLCPYPQVATYDGKGDTNSGASFACKAPNRVESSR
jgi:feruloyl esterase